MAKFDDLPEEIVAQVLNHLNEKDFRYSRCAILRTSQRLYRISCLLLFQHVTLECGLLTHMSKLPDHFHTSMQTHNRAICVDLVGFERCPHFTTVCGLGLARAHKHCNDLLCFTEWTATLNNELVSLGARLKSYSCMRDFSLRTRAAWPSFGLYNAGQRFVRAVSLISVLDGLACLGASLLTLDFDTADAEDSAWTPPPAAGIGATCAEHVCSHFASTLARLPRLRRVRVRRRELCPALFRFAGPRQDTATAADTDRLAAPVLANLETFVVNMRLAATQLVAHDTWRAHARHCRCFCLCAACRDVEPPNYPLPGELFPLEAQLLAAGRQVVGCMPKIKTFKVLGFREPGASGERNARRPFIADVLTETTVWVATGATAVSGMDWEGVETEEMGDGWEKVESLDARHGLVRDEVPDEVQDASGLEEGDLGGLQPGLAVPLQLLVATQP